MKKDIHPEYHQKAKVTCSCGNTFEIGSTMKEIHIEVCSQCHPFYTGKQKLIDDAGIVNKFEKRKVKQAEISKIKVGKKLNAPALKLKKQKIHWQEITFLYLKTLSILKGVFIMFKKLS